MLGVKRFVQSFATPLEAEMALMNHYAAKQKALYAWERRYAHLQFVTKWAPLLRRHRAAATAAQSPDLAA